MKKLAFFLVIFTSFTLFSCKKVSQKNITYEFGHYAENINRYYSNDYELIQNDSNSIIKIYLYCSSGSIKPIVDKFKKNKNNELEIHVTAKLNGNTGTADIKFWDISIIESKNYLDNVSKAIISVN